MKDREFTQGKINDFIVDLARDERDDSRLAVETLRTSYDPRREIGDG